jgi:dinuclear metal center YbgI/SA1388 family protein
LGKIEPDIFEHERVSMEKNAGVPVRTLEAALSDLLQPGRISDYCPNGLQVEGRPVVRKLVTGVTASLDFLEKAIYAGADAVLVHHGLFWKGDPQTVTGFRRQRLARVLAADLNVFAYHLPLDVHPELGNNIQLGARLGWQLERTVGERGLVCVGSVQQALTVAQWCERIEDAFGRHVECIGDAAQTVSRVAWCTGGAASGVEQAALAGADLYLTGELSEPAVHVAKETGCVLLGAGHHATERGGVLALGIHLAAQFGLDVEFIDCPVPV